MFQFQRLLRSGLPALLFTCLAQSALGQDPPDIAAQALPVNVNLTCPDGTTFNGQYYLADSTTLNIYTGPQWNNGHDCGNAAHKTMANRRYAHIHYSGCSFPMILCNAQGLPYTYLSLNGGRKNVSVSAADILNFWDAQMGYPSAAGTNPTVTSSGSVDTTTNCYGYAFDQGTWVQDQTYLFADNATMQPQPQNNPAVVGVAQQSGDHGYVVTAIYDGTTSSPAALLKVTVEKAREAAVYTDTFSPGRAPNATQYKKN